MEAVTFQTWREIAESGEFEPALAALEASVTMLEPDYVGVRGAACEGDRRGRIDSVRVRALATLVGERREGSTAMFA